MHVASNLKFFSMQAYLVGIILNELKLSTCKALFFLHFNLKVFCHLKANQEIKIFVRGFFTLIGCSNYFWNF